MSNYIEIVVLVEGRTEQVFIESLLSEYMAVRNVFMTPIQMSKPGQKGGDVKFARVINDISNHLKQRTDTYLTLFFDYYGVKEWPGLDEAKKQQNPLEIARVINTATQQAVNEKLSSYRSDVRFIPHVAIHEFESLLFSDPVNLAVVLNADQLSITSILNEFNDPEKINNAPETAPSKRLEELCPRFKKTSTGITAAKKIGIESMRQQCRVFNNWITQLENIVGDHDGKK